MLLSVASVWQI